GDLFLVIHMQEHEHFERDGENLLCQVKIGFAQAALGAKVKVPSLDGEKELDVPAGTQSGETFTLKGAGFPRPRRTGRGDEIVQVLVVTPKKLSARERELLQELAKIEGESIADDGLVNKIKKKFRGKAPGG
ncbi:MAG TPA: DnaJ C-terminal domain-containing protein, partial [bacterium]|nr:DnaJ C-terminal domain-containing protein [bacterium]